MREKERQRDDGAHTLFASLFFSFIIHLVHQFIQMSDDLHDTSLLFISFKSRYKLIQLN